MLVPHVSEQTVTWVVDINYVVEGKAHTISFPDDPFVTTGLSATKAWWDWRVGAGWSNGPAPGAREAASSPSSETAPRATSSEPAPLAGGMPCGTIPPDGQVGELAIAVTSGKLQCSEALSVAKQYIRTSRAQGARGVTFEGWKCGMNFGSGVDMAHSNMACRRGGDSITIGTPG